MNDKIKSIVLVTILLTVLIAVSGRIYYRDADYMVTDDGYYEVSLYFFEHIFHGIQLNDNYLTGSVYQKTPLIPFIAAFIFNITGVGEDFARITNLLAVIILLFSMIGIEVQLKGGWKKGIYSPFFFFFVPLFYNLSIWYYVDMQLTALIALDLYFMLKSEHFSNLKYSVLFGIVFGLGQLTKITFFIYLSGAILGYFALRRFNIKNVLLAGLSAFLVFGPFYLIHLRILYEVYFPSAYGEDALKLMFGLFADKVKTTFMQRAVNILVYILNPSHYFLIFLIVASLIFIFRCATKIKIRKADKGDAYFLLLFSSLVLPVIIISSFIQQDQRYNFPLLIPLILFIALNLSFKRKWLINFLLGSLFVLSSLSMIHFFSYYEVHTPDFSEIIPTVQDNRFYMIMNTGKWGYAMWHYVTLEGLFNRFNYSTFGYSSYYPPCLAQFLNTSFVNKTDVYVIFTNKTDFEPERQSAQYYDLKLIKKLNKTLVKTINTDNSTILIYNVSWKKNSLKAIIKEIP